MRRFLALLIAASICGGAWGSNARAAGPTIYVSNESTLVADAQLADALPAFQAAVSNEFSAAWGTDATLVYTTGDIPPGAWSIVLSDTADVFGAAGYHYINNGVPAAKVFADEGIPWQLVFTHEAFEMLVDPWLNRSTRGGARWWLVEVGDPVEGEQCTYTRPGASGAAVVISDFVTPAWYMVGSRAPVDYTRCVRKPFRLAKHGYASFWSLVWNDWTQVFADHR